MRLPRSLFCTVDRHTGSAIRPTREWTAKWQQKKCPAGDPPQGTMLKLQDIKDRLFFSFAGQGQHWEGTGSQNGDRDASTGYTGRRIGCALFVFCDFNGISPGHFTFIQQCDNKGINPFCKGIVLTRCIGFAVYLNRVVFFHNSNIQRNGFTGGRDRIVVFSGHIISQQVQKLQIQ